VVIILAFQASDSGSIPDRCKFFKIKLFKKIVDILNISTLVRAVKETDLKSVGLCPRRFKSYSVRLPLARDTRKRFTQYSSVGRAADCRRSNITPVILRGSLVQIRLLRFVFIKLKYFLFVLL
jgi:hypothetical protein